MTDAQTHLPSLAEHLSAPPEVVQELGKLKNDLVAAAGDKLTALVLHGSLARGRYRPWLSDVNIVLVLADTSCQTLKAIAPALRRAWRAVQAEPMIVTAEDIPQLADVFPIKVLEIQKHHIVLHGQNPFADIEVNHERLRFRVRQQLRNALLRLRRQYVSICEDPVAMVNTLSEAARNLAVDLATVMHLAGKELPDESRTDGILDASAAALGLDQEALAQAAALRRDGNKADDLQALYDRMLTTMDKALAVVRNLQEES